MFCIIVSSCIWSTSSRLIHPNNPLVSLLTSLTIWSQLFNHFMISVIFQSDIPNSISIKSPLLFVT